MTRGPGISRGLSFTTGVSNGTRTRDIRHHKAALYQLSYTHHEAPVSARGRRTLYWVGAPEFTSASFSGPVSPVIEPPCFVAICRAASVSGPGGATKTASR